MADHHNYAHGIDEVQAIRARAESERGYVDGSFVSHPAGVDTRGDDLFFCAWRWETPQPENHPRYPKCVHGCFHRPDTVCDCECHWTNPSDSRERLRATNIMPNWDDNVRREM